MYKKQTHSDDKSPLNKTIEIPVMIIVVRAIFCETTTIIHECF